MHLMYGEDKRPSAEARLGDELALLRLYRECSAECTEAKAAVANRPPPYCRLEA